MFKLARDRLPEQRDLCSQSTVSRAENLPDLRALLRMGRAMADHYCESFRQVPRRIVLDIDDTFDAVHGGQRLRLFNAYYDEHGFQPILGFDDEGRMIAAVLRPAGRPDRRQIIVWLRRLIAAIRGNWPRVQILLRADSHYCTPEVLRFCRARRLDYVLGVAPTATLRRHVATLEAGTTARAAKTGGDKLRRFEEFYDGAASWDRVERIIARVEAGPRASIPASSSPASKACGAAPSTRTSTAPAARPRTISRRGRRILPPTAPPAAVPPPIRCDAAAYVVFGHGPLHSCTSAPTG